MSARAPATSLNSGGAGWVFLLALICATGSNYWNLQVMRGLPDADVKLQAGAGAIATADDASYLRPMEDLLFWAKGIPHERTLVTRSPGYGLPYLVFRSILPVEGSITAVVIWQVLLFAFSAALLWITLQVCRTDRRLLMSVVQAFAVLPMFAGFLFYTLTEGVTPALLLICSCSALLYHQHGRKWWLILGSISWSLLMLSRPILGFGGIPLLFVLIQRSGWKKAVALSMVAALPLILWITVESVLSGYLISPHPVYRPESTNVYRPPHAAFWDLGKSWGMTAVEFHDLMEYGFQMSLLCEEISPVADEFMKNAPTGHLSDRQREEIHKAFAEWSTFTCSTHRKILASGSRFPSTSFEKETHIVDRLRSVTWEYRLEHPVQYAIIVPSRVIWKMLVHSNLNLYMFQHTYRGQWWMETLRWISLIMHVTLLASIFIIPWLRIHPIIRIAAACALTYLIYLAFIQRGVEERYTLPVLHLAVLLAPFAINTIFLRKQKELGSMHDH